MLSPYVAFLISRAVTSRQQCRLQSVTWQLNFPKLTRGRSRSPGQLPLNLDEQIWPR